MQIKCTIDARGLTCPRPLLEARQGLNQVAMGECIEVLTSDSASVNDFHRLVELTSHRLIEFEQRAYGDYRYVLQKG